jgi:hypothetical protein
MRQNPQLPALLFAAAFLSACATDTIEDRRRGQEIVCHDGEKTLSVSNASAHNHYQHGDTPGPCPDEG